jgi:hypothetical protein
MLIFPANMPRLTSTADAHTLLRFSSTRSSWIGRIRISAEAAPSKNQAMASSLIAIIGYFNHMIRDNPTFSIFFSSTRPTTPHKSTAAFLLLSRRHSIQQGNIVGKRPAPISSKEAVGICRSPKLTPNTPTPFCVNPPSPREMY